MTETSEQRAERAEAVARTALHTLRLAAAERDQLQDRIDAAIAETASWYPDGPPVPRDVLNRIRAALQGNQTVDEVPHG